MIAIDDRDPSCVVVTWPARRVGAPELARFGDEVIARLRARGGAPVAVLVDVRRAAPLEPSAVARLRELDARVCEAGVITRRAIVVPSVIAARVLGVMIAAARPRVTTRAFVDLERARAWLAP
ncbi:STAS/SEC14 domain-containing protein [Sandaracinus amylolyticus]|uniref:STAS/SEC14 domain-containing protein n=1 Tax=Sandaracinus amylolyticus TaxID=927083 RepID=A0A0F6SI27_9BACT|nr:STAS/SEC14 domain-containing protein [Sandaracinus amylolyticus]AKF11464.1 hypothetical protein DB32_008613 [Sandaracinus amylolyticus]